MKATKRHEVSEVNRVFISDCEGPISKNDNAFELASHFIPGGDNFFSLISKYDDVQADLVKRKGYKAGDTLKLILPFLRAYGATNEKIEEFSSQNVLLVPGAEETLRFVSGIMPSFIISTSYEQYISAICTLVGFPKANTYCTRLNIDKYTLGAEEVEDLQALSDEITGMPMIEIPSGANSLSDLSPRDRVTVKRLDDIFWNKILRMAAGRMLVEVNPVGGYEKARAVRDAAETTGTDLSNVIYVGDSITDVESFRLVRDNGGLTVSFNGNQYAIRSAEIAVLSNHTVITSILADVFNKFGKGTLNKIVGNWSLPSLEKYCNQELYAKFMRLHSERPIKVELITPENMEKLTKESSAFRKTVRGEAVGKLG